MPVTTRQTPNGRPARGQPDVVSRIAPLDEDGGGGLKVLLYGESGSGKTTFWATFPGPILAVLCSGSRNPGELRSVNTPANRKKISQVTLTDSSEMAALIEHLQGGKYATVVLDHVSGLQDLILKEVLGITKIPAMKNWGMAQQQQYGQVAQQCTALLRDLLSLDANVVVVGQERVFKGKDDGVDSDVIKPVVGVGTMPSIATWLNPACDYILQAFKRAEREVKEVKVGNAVTRREVATGRIEYCLRTEPHEYFMTKFRCPKGTYLPDVITDPSYEKLLEVINGEAAK